MCLSTLWIWPVCGQKDSLKQLLLQPLAKPLGHQRQKHINQRGHQNERDDQGFEEHGRVLQWLFENEKKHIDGRVHHQPNEDGHFVFSRSFHLVSFSLRDKCSSINHLKPFSERHFLWKMFPLGLRMRQWLWADRCRLNAAG